MASTFQTCLVKTNALQTRETKPLMKPMIETQVCECVTYTERTPRSLVHKEHPGHQTLKDKTPQDNQLNTVYCTALTEQYMNMGLSVSAVYKYPSMQQTSTVISPILKKKKCCGN